MNSTASRSFTLLICMSWFACTAGQEHVDAPKDAEVSGSTDTLVIDTPVDDEPVDSPVIDEPVDDTEVTGPLQGWCHGQSEDFSFFVTSMAAIWAISGDDIHDLTGGLGGNFGGIAGADQLCQDIAAATGHGDRTWRAFLSATDDGSGSPVHAIERIGEGPWHDANGRLVASGIQGLLAGNRPDGDEQTIDDLPDECGVPLSVLGDSHDIVTGSDATGHLSSTDPASTCNDWTSTDADLASTENIRDGILMCGHSFPRQSGGGGGAGNGGGGGRGGANWMSDHPLRGCSEGANFLQNGPGEGTCIGCSGGYGGIYCFAL